MPFPSASRPFLTAALAHLALASTLVGLGPEVGTFGPRWDLFLWLVLLGFVGTTASGFALHLFPTVARRPAPPASAGWTAFLLTEGSLVAGGLSLSGALTGATGRTVFVLGAFLFLAAELLVVAALVRGLSRPARTTPAVEERSGDRVTVPLFLFAWSAAVAAAALFVLSGFGPGPGFGWWIAAVHLFVLGHALPLIAAVSLRLLPRALDAELPKGMAPALAGAAMAGATLVSAGMVAVPLESARALDLLALPEAAFGVLLAGAVLVLIGRARTRRAEVVIELVAVFLLWGGGAVGLGMVFDSAYAPLGVHVFLNVFGFTGLTILYMWFGMIAPFQRVSHDWTRRMRWSLSVLWVGAVVLAAGALSGATADSGPVLALAGGLLLTVALAWAMGTVPVLYPSVNPLPGVSPEAIRSLRERWRKQ